MPFREYDKFSACNLSNGMTLPMQKKTLPLQKSLFYKIVSMETIGNRSQPQVASRVSTCSPKGSHFANAKP